VVWVGMQTNQKSTAGLLSVFDAERLTGRRVSSWRRDIRLRRIPYVKLGRSVRIPREVIEKMIVDGWHEPGRSS
jgi:hypothetical protein